MLLIRTFSAATALAVCLLFATATESVRADEVMSAATAERLGLVQAWNRSVSSPSGVQTISDMELYVHQTQPHQYLEIVTPLESSMSDVGKGDADAMMKKSAMKDSIGKEAMMKESAMKDSMGKEAMMMKPKQEMRVLSRVLIRPESDPSPTGTATFTSSLFPRGSSFTGLREAQRVADNEIRRLKRRRINATTRVVSSPRIGLYTVASDGTLESKDAETGQTLWTTRVGNSAIPYNQIGVSDDHLSVVNGGNLIVVETETGRVEQELVLGVTPIFGAVNAGDYAMIQGIRGGVICYPLSDLERDPYTESVRGTAITHPIQAPNSSKVAWSTDQGFVFVMEMEGTPSTLFRLKTDGIVTGRIAEASGDRFFFGSDSGQVYALEATREGVVRWSKPFGEPFFGHPIVYDDQLFIRSAYGNLYCLSTDDGRDLWNDRVQGVSSLIGVVQNNLFVRHNDESIFVIDRITGEVVGDFPDLQPAATIVNGHTDRLYLVSATGGVQCLRPIDSELPKMNPQLDAMKKEQMKAAEMQKEVKPNQPLPGASGDPFGGGGSDPFGGGGSDPFGGGGSDPFGGGGGEDPFSGGGSDPFGGGGGEDPFGGGGEDPFGGAGGDPFGGDPFN